MLAAIPETALCWKMVVADSNIEVYWGRDLSGWNLAGIVELPRPYLVETIKPIVTVWLPGAQTAYPTAPNHGRQLTGPSIVYEFAKGRYRTNDGRIRDRILRVSLPLNITWPPMTGVYDGDLVMFR